MAGFDELAGKAKAFLNDEKVQNALHGKQAEEVSDRILDAAANAASKVTGGKHDDAIEKARARADEAVGDR